MIFTMNENSLLIEDGSKEPELFRGCGGFAYQYTNDESFLRWLDRMCSESKKRYGNAVRTD